MIVKPARKKNMNVTISITNQDGWMQWFCIIVISCLGLPSLPFDVVIHSIYNLWSSVILRDINFWNGLFFWKLGLIHYCQRLPWNKCPLPFTHFVDEF